MERSPDGSTVGGRSGEWPVRRRNAWASRVWTWAGTGAVDLFRIGKQCSEGDFVALPASETMPLTDEQTSRCLLLLHVCSLLDGLLSFASLLNDLVVAV